MALLETEDCYSDYNWKLDRLNYVAVRWFISEPSVGVVNPLLMRQDWFI